MDERFLGLSVTAWIGLFTFCLVLIGIVQARIYRLLLDTTKDIERAYIGINDHEGVIFRRLHEETRVTASVNFAVINRGRTPAQITDGVVDIRILSKTAPLPERPKYRPHTDKPSAFLVSDALMSIGWNLDISKAEYAAVREGISILYVWGYVDYIDRFKTRHRTGFGREYGPAIDTLRDAGKINRDALNLSVIQNIGYNYDCERKKGDGNDWDEPKQ